jgi:hypothetical protein
MVPRYFGVKQKKMKNDEKKANFSGLLVALLNKKGKKERGKKGREASLNA